MKRLLLLVMLFTVRATAQQPPVYVDKQVVMRWSSNRSEATFFGVNYTVPFAYGYRLHQRLGINMESAIDADVHHMSRLGLNAHIPASFLCILNHPACSRLLFQLLRK